MHAQEIANNGDHPETRGKSASHHHQCRHGPYAPLKAVSRHGVCDGEQRRTTMHPSTFVRRKRSMSPSLIRLGYAEMLNSAARTPSRSRPNRTISPIGRGISAVSITRNHARLLRTADVGRWESCRCCPPRRRRGGMGEMIIVVVIQ